MATNTKRKPKPRASKKPTPRKRTAARKKQGRLEPLHLDLIALGLAILATFEAAVLWGGWSGGPVGAGITHLLKLAIGSAAVLAPVLLMACAVIVLARESKRPQRAVWIGLLCLLLGLCLALTAGTFGLSHNQPAPSWSVASLEHRGGAIGQVLYLACFGAAAQIGAHLMAIFLIVGGAVLVSGITIASILANTREGATDATRMFRDGTEGARRKFKEHRAAAAAKQAVKPAKPITVPDPEPERLIVRATHVEAPAANDHGWQEDDETPESGFTFVPEPDPEPLDLEDEEENIDLEDADQDPSLGHEPSAPLTPMGRYRDSVLDDPSFVWKRPPSRLLTRSKKRGSRTGQADSQRKTAVRLVEALGHFGVSAEVVGTVSGPHITRYELRLAPGTKVNKVAALRDDLAYALASTDIRILAPIPGKQAVGVEVPNDERQMVLLGDVWQDPPEGWSPLTVWLGKDVAGRAIGADLARMPHLLVAGTTGSGKSACVNSMLSSILLRATPREVRLVLVDPKQVELNHYESIPHLLTPVITNPKMAANALANLVREMEQRYALMSIHKTRGLRELNTSRERRGDPALPYILCVIDELADLMMVAPAEVEDSIIRLAQKARAVGIHLVLATQSPRVDVITGMIKANVPSRVAFSVSSQTDSRVILDQNGAETLLGQGDMLFAPVGTSNPQRIQGAFLDEEQVGAICDHWRKQGEPAFQEELLEEVIPEAASKDEQPGFDPDEDSMLVEAITLAAEMQTASTSMIQRRLRVGYTRAGRLIDMLERRGIISGYEGSKPRQVLITEADLPRVLAQLEAREPAQAALDLSSDDD